jgi:dolichyl-phosphate-mannose--protein O-mannosyl transferase
MFFLLLGFYFVLLSKPWFASIALGLALATKWSAIYYMVAFGLFLLYSDYRQEKALESDKPILSMIRKSLWLRILQFGVIPIFVYIFTWLGWFLTSTGWDRKWSHSVVRSFLHYHSEMWNFHTHLTDAHPYSANPWGWLLMVRPTSFFYSSPKNCGAPSCSQEILALGTPLLWWSGVVALFVAFGYWIARREWQSGLILLSFAAGYLPWFLMQKRTMFTFYAISFEPFLILLIVFALSKYLEPLADGIVPRRRLYITYLFIALVALNFLYFLPLYIGNTISYSSWFNHMWLPSWI